MAPCIEDIIRELREHPQDIIYFDSRTILKYFEEQDRIGFEYCEDLVTYRVYEELYCYTDVDECHWVKRSSMDPLVPLLAWVRGEKARYVRGRIMEIRRMRGRDAWREFIDLGIYIFKNSEFK